MRRDEFAFAGAVIAVGIATWLPVLISVETRPLVGWIAAIVIGLAIERLTRALSPAVLVAGLVIAGALVASGLVTETTRYMSVLVASTAIGVRCAMDMWRRKRLYSAPPLPVTVAAGLYVVWAAVATATSIDRQLGVTYLAGILAVIVLAFWAVPNLLSRPYDRALLLAVIGGLGVTIALTVYVGSLIGPSIVFGRSVGDYLFGSLVVAGHSTGLEFGRSAGVYLAPFEPAVVMAMGIVALLPFGSFNRGRARLVAALAILFIVPALVLSLDRSAWLAAAVGAGFYAAMLAAASLQPKFAAALALLFLLLLTAVTTNLVGVNVLREVCVIPLSPGQSCPDWARRLEELSLRGGGGLSGRQFLWSASWDAIKARPVSGYGPGTDVIAIQPYLHGPGLTYLGLSSHSTWLRAGVEMGLPGLVLLIVVIAASGWVFVRRLKLGPPTRPRASRASDLPTGWGGESVELVWPALLAGMLPAMTFEAFLLGGVTLSSLFLAMALGMVAIPSVSSAGDRAFSRAPSAATPAAATV